jgi:hypothetical protein
VIFTAGGVVIPLRLLDCFRFVTPVVCDVFGAFLAADSGGRAVFLTVVEIFGPGSEAFNTKEGDAMVTVSAICRREALRYSDAPAWSDLRGQDAFLVTDRFGEVRRFVTEAERWSLSKVESKLGLEA